MKVPNAQLILLKYLRIHMWSTVQVLQIHLKHNSPQATYQLLKRMQTNRLITSAIIELPANNRVRLYGITEKGLDYAFDLNEKVTSTRFFEPSKVSPSTLQHEIDIQKAHTSAVSYGWRDWTNGSHLGKRCSNMKIPDATALSPAGIKVCIEIEREIKSSRRYRDIIASHLSARKQGQWSHVVYLCPSKDMAKRLERKLRSLKYLLWNGSRIALTEAHFEHFTFDSYEYFTRRLP